MLTVMTGLKSAELVQGGREGSTDRDQDKWEALSLADRCLCE